MTRHRLLALSTVLLASIAPALAADSAAEAYKAIGLKVKDVLSGTSINAKVIPGDGEQFVAITSYMTGSQDRASAVNVRLDVFERVGGKLETVYTRDYAKENGGYVADGNLQVLDLDRDGVSEIVVAYDDYRDPLIEQQLAEVILWEESGFVVAWAGPMSFDATKAARTLPAEHRDRYIREIDVISTLRTRGVTLFLNKRVIAVAGETLAEPKTVQETFPLRIRKEF